jgi:hypothetical protein
VAAATALLLVFSAAHCGGNVVVDGAATATSGAGASSSGSCNGAVPAQHRAAATPCAPSPASVPCMTDAECVESTGFGGETMGKCTAAQLCDFDACTTDATCGGSALCACASTSGPVFSTTNICLTSGCRTDADCGSGGYCSPTADFTCARGVTSYQCHTCADGCANDTDCTSNPNPGLKQGTCAFDPTVGHWSCSYAICSG